MQRNVIVICDIDTAPVAYKEDHILVIRAFHKGQPTMWVDVIRALQRFPQAKTLLTQFDFAMYGNPLVSSLGLIMLGLVRIKGYKTFVTLHHIVDDILQLKGHVGLGNGPKDEILGKTYNFLFHTFYRILSVVSSHVVVLETSLKHKLQTIAPWVQASAIPHGVDTQLQPIQTKLARKKLGIPQNEHVILFFGYINWFKGADIFARTFARVQTLLGKNVHIIIAGGESPTLSEKPYYQDFFRHVRREVQTSAHINMTGYVPQKDIATYFSAADLIVFPYRHYMTASGVMSLAFSYRKPFIISRPLAEMFHSEDFERELARVGLKTREITFDLYPQSIIDMTHDVLENGRKKKLATMAGNLRLLRSYTKIAKYYDELLFAPKLVLVAAPLVRYS
jgi:glycosyltransferase involved in cell wall biosynthesis